MEKEHFIDKLDQESEKLKQNKDKQDTDKQKNKQEEITHYTAETYLDALVKVFCKESERFGSEVKDFQKKFKEFVEIDKIANLPISKVPYINKIKKYKFNLIEKYALAFLIIDRIFPLRCSEIELSKIAHFFIVANIDTPKNIYDSLLDDNCKLFKSDILRKRELGTFSSRGGIGIRKDIVQLLINFKMDKRQKNKIVNNTIKKPTEIYNELKKYVVGQDLTLKNISSAVYEHLLKCKLNANMKSKDKLDKTNCLIIGPTGTGKTYICETLGKILDIPIYVADASQFTESGYVGVSVENMLLGLERKTGNKMIGTKFPPSIIYIDEIDKTAINKSKDDLLGQKGVQEEILKILESEKYMFSGGKFGSPREYNLSNVMFVLGGAFSGLDKIIEKRTNKNKQKQIGFGAISEVEQKDINILQQVCTEDLVEYGIMPEFMGRLTNRSVLNSLTKYDFMNILKQSNNNVIEQYKKIFKEAGISLTILDETIEFVADRAIKNNTGARGLKTVLSKTLNKMLFEATEQNKKEFVLTPEMLKFA